MAAQSSTSKRWIESGGKAKSLVADGVRSTRGQHVAGSRMPLRYLTRRKQGGRRERGHGRGGLGSPRGRPASKPAATRRRPSLGGTGRHPPPRLLFLHGLTGFPSSFLPSVLHAPGVRTRLLFVSGVGQLALCKCGADRIDTRAHLINTVADSSGCAASRCYFCPRPTGVHFWEAVTAIVGI